MQTFWREEPLDEREKRLLDLVLEAHQRSASERRNVSSAVVQEVFGAGGNVQQAVAAAVLSFGGLHGPVERTYELLADDDPAALAYDMLDEGKKVPGWGSSFADDIWAGTEAFFVANWPALAAKIHDVTDLLHRRRINIEPNPACWTAATAIALGIPKHISLWLVLHGRLAAWMKLLL